MGSDIEGLARLMYWLEISINQGAKRNNWDELLDEAKATWIKAAEGIERITPTSWALNIQE